MYPNEKRWHWIFTGKEFKFADESFPFAIVRYVHNQADDVPPHRHGFTELVFVLDGNATHSIQVPGHARYNCRISKGDVFIINPEEEHHFIFEEDEYLDVLNIDFQYSFFDNILNQDNNEVRIMDFLYIQSSLPLAVRFGNILKLSEKETENIIIQVDNIMYELKKKEIGYVHMVGLYMALIFTLLSRKYISAVERGLISGSKKDNQVSNIFRVMGYIEHHYSEDLSKEELARIAMCSVRNLSRTFKDLTGDTVIQYTHKIRIDKASTLLVTTDAKISDIAIRVGFNDISFFNKIFKGVLGMTPSEYRKNYQNFTSSPQDDLLV